MKSYRLVHAFIFISLFGSMSVLADSFGLSNSRADYYGIVNAVYHEETRMVISDISLLYNHGTSFYSANGRRFSDITKVLTVGTPVKYSYIEQYPDLILKRLEIITMREFNGSKMIGVDQK